MLQEIKKSLSKIALAAIIIGSFFAACYIPSAKMAMTQKPLSQSSNFTKGLEECCTTQSSHHILTAIGIPANPISLESFLILLGLSLLSLIGVDAFLTVNNFINDKQLYARQFLLRLFNYLVQFFSSGVLQPKLYNA